MSPCRDRIVSRMGRVDDDRFNNWQECPSARVCVVTREKLQEEKRHEGIYQIRGAGSVKYYLGRIPRCSLLRYESQGKNGRAIGI